MRKNTKFADEIASGMIETLSDSNFKQVFASEVSQLSESFDSNRSSFIRIAKKADEKADKKNLKKEKDSKKDLKKDLDLEDMKDKKKSKKEKKEEKKKEASEAIRYMVDQLVATSSVLDEMGLAKSSSKVLFALDSILKEASSELEETEEEDDFGFDDEEGSEYDSIEYEGDITEGSYLPSEEDNEDLEISPEEDGLTEFDSREQWEALKEAKEDGTLDESMLTANELKALDHLSYDEYMEKLDDTNDRPYHPTAYNAPTYDRYLDSVKKNFGEDEDEDEEDNEEMPEDLSNEELDALEYINAGDSYDEYVKNIEDIGDEPISKWEWDALKAEHGSQEEDGQEYNLDFDDNDVEDSDEENEDCDSADDSSDDCDHDEDCGHVKEAKRKLPEALQKYIDKKKPGKKDSKEDKKDSDKKDSKKNSDKKDSKKDLDKKNEKKVKKSYLINDPETLKVLAEVQKYIRR